MVAIHEGQVKKYVENGHAEVRDEAATTISTFSKKLVEGKEIHKRKYDLLLTTISKLQTDHLNIFETNLNSIVDLMARDLNAHGEENIKLRASIDKLLLYAQTVIENIILKLGDKEIPDTPIFNSSFTHVKELLMFYYSQMAMPDFKLAKELKKTVVKPSTQMYGVEQFDDGEMLLSPKGIVFLGKLQNNVQKKNMLCTNLKEMFLSL
ncbi:unnamed protein product [Lactuca virosa]|uniref:Uncharacterized protein n=1 Tax=Lactuca virosa TaxID=75947 RepID=A0AAU9LYY9_9ASTR|nr:unnamed protein product [Lactuca virosa]